MKKFLRFLPWILVVGLSAVIGLMVYMYVYSYSGPVNERASVVDFFFGGRVEALNTDLEKYGIRDIYDEKVGLPFEQFEVGMPLLAGHKNMVWKWSYSVDMSQADIEHEADIFEVNLQRYCKSLEGKMNESVDNSSLVPSQLTRRVNGDLDAVMFSCLLEDTSQRAFSMFLTKKESKIIKEEFNRIAFGVSFDSEIRGD